MTRYLALLRDINVGTALNRIRMDALKRLFEEAGFDCVETYIQKRKRALLLRAAGGRNARCH